MAALQDFKELVPTIHYGQFIPYQRNLCGMPIPGTENIQSMMGVSKHCNPVTVAVRVIKQFLHK